MEQSIWQKFQRVKITDICHIIFFILAYPVSRIYRLKRKNLWLICDNQMEARDNGYWLFRYIRKNHPEQDVMFAIDKKSPDYARVKELGQVVRYGSFIHWIYYLTALYNISSQKGGKPNAAVCYLLEVYGILKNIRIFLQHGITQNDVQFLYYEHTRMRLFVCAADREYEYVKTHFGYPEGYVQNLGFCRFDNLHDNQIKSNQILVMPTWRNWIGRPTSESYHHEDISDFKNTEYFKYWNGFLNAPELKQWLLQNDLKLVFYPHRDMQGFLDEFTIESDNIVLASWPDSDVQQLLKESAFLVTDYSSVAMDFAYMNKPLTYYQFDYERFRKGHYAEGYFDYETDGFGPVCRTQEEVYAVMKRSEENGFLNSEQYKKKHNEFFTVFDKENCKRNFEAIKNINIMG